MEPDLEVTVACVAEYTGDILKASGVTVVEVYANAVTGEAIIFLTLCSDTTSARLDVTKRMGEIIDNFHDDFAIEFYFGDAVPRPGTSTARALVAA